MTSVEIIDRMRELERHIKRMNIDDWFDVHVIEHRYLMRLLWQTPIKWNPFERDPSQRGERFRIRGTRAERIANRLQFGR